MKTASLLALAIALSTSSVSALTIEEAHVKAEKVAEKQPAAFRWASDGWVTQDKLWDHGSFAFVLAQLTEDVFRPDTDRGRILAFAANMGPWAIKEILDGYGLEGASYKDFVWSALGAGLALTIH